MLVCTTQNNLCRCRNLRLDVWRNGHENRMGEAQLHVQPLPISTILRPPRVILQRGTVPDPHQVQRHAKPLSHSNNRVIDQRPCETPHASLFLLGRVIHGERDDAISGWGKAHILFERDGGRTQRASNFESCGCRIEGDGGRDRNGCFSDVRGVAMGWSRRGEAANCPLEDSRPREHQVKLIPSFSGIDPASPPAPSFQSPPSSTHPPRHACGWKA